MRIPLACTTLCLFLLAALSTACLEEPQCGNAPLTPDVRQCMIDTVDQMVHAHYPFALQKGIDLQHFSTELRALPITDTDDDTFVFELARTISTLQDGHTRIELHLDQKTASLPISYQEMNGEIIITGSYDPALNLQPGTRIETIDGQPALQYVHLRQALPYTSSLGRGPMQLSQNPLLGQAGTTVQLGLASGQEISLRRTYYLPEPTARKLPGNIGYINISTFGFIDDLDRLDRIVNDLMDSDALIIDLRGNGGGFPSVTDGLFGRLIDRDVPHFNMVAADGTFERTIGPKPRGKTFQGPVVMLTDKLTFSASNYLAQRLTYHKRGTLIGSKTGGGAASPDKGVFLVPGIWFQVSTYVLQTPEGDNAEEGIAPDILVEFSPDEITLGLAHKSAVPGHDKVLDRAIRFLQELP